jgi:hypothetical protein
MKLFVPLFILFFLATLLIVFSAVGQTVTVDLPEPKPDSQICEDVKIGNLCPQTGRRYYGDPLRFDSVNKTWRQAATTPGMLLMQGMMWGAVTLDAASTQHCIHIHTCHEANPVFGKSTASRYAIGMALFSVSDWLLVREKQHGHGIRAVIGFTIISTIEFMEFAHNRQYESRPLQ